MKMEKLNAELAAKSAAIASMNASLRREFEDMQEEIHKNVSKNVQFYYMIGTRATKIQTNSAKYGDGAIDKMSTALIIDTSLIYKAIRLVDMFPDDELKALLNRETVIGTRIGWAHFTQLVAVEDERVRGELVEEIFRKGLSSRALKDEIAKRLATRFHHRAPTPSTVSGALSRIHTQSDKLIDSLTRDWKPDILDPIRDADSSSIEKLLERVDGDLAALDKVAESAILRAVDIRKLKGELTARLKKLEEEATVKSEAPAPPPPPPPVAPSTRQRVVRK